MSLPGHAQSVRDGGVVSSAKAVYRASLWALFLLVEAN